MPELWFMPAGASWAVWAILEPLFAQNVDHDERRPCFELPKADARPVLAEDVASSIDNASDMVLLGVL